jgi:SAM-dependent methyltransferase
MVQLAGIKPGNKVLDVACGYGEPSIAAAKAAGPNGSVVASDISAGQLAFGRERAQSAGLRNIEFIECAANALEFPANTFDAVLSRWGIIFDPEIESALGRIRGFTKSGGHAVLVSWAEPPRVPFLALPFKVARDRLQIPPPPTPPPGPFGRPTKDSLAGALKAGGWQDVQADEADVVFEWPTVEDYIVFAKETIPPLTQMMAQHPAEVQAEVWDLITNAVRGKFPNGQVKFTNVAIIANGRA